MGLGQGVLGELDPEEYMLLLQNLLGYVSSQDRLMCKPQSLILPLGQLFIRSEHARKGCGSSTGCVGRAARGFTGAVRSKASWPGFRAPVPGSSTWSGPG